MLSNRPDEEHIVMRHSSTAARWSTLSPLMMLTIRRILVGFALLVASPVEGGAQVRTVLRGVPTFKITEAGTERTPEKLAPDRAAGFIVVVSRVGDKYLWASRENKELVRIELGAFITYVAVNGSGYIRVIAPGMKEAVSLMGDTEVEYDYVEHLLVGLKSVTYYGKVRIVK